MSATAASARQASAASTAEATSTVSKLAVISAVCAAARASLFLFNVLKLLGYHKAAYVTLACVALVLVVAWGVYSLFDEDGATAIKEGSFLLAESEVMERSVAVVSPTPSM